MSNKSPLDKKSLPAGRRGQLPILFFISAVGLSALVYVIIYTVMGNGNFSDTFFLRCADFYMDFFNSVRDAAQGSGVYTERGVIYPPMANLIYLFFSRFTPNLYNSTSFTERYEWREYFSPMMLVLIVSLALALVLFYIIYAKLNADSPALKFLFAFFAIFNMPILFTLERGNILLLCLICLLIYAVTYSSENRVCREIGLLALAFAFSLKLYPVIFGWLLVADKRIKDALRCALYGILMLIVPSFFFGGPICLYRMMLNVLSFSSGSGNTLGRILDFIHLPTAAQTAVTMLAYLWVLICGVCFAVSPFIRAHKQWKTWLCGFVTILCVPSLTAPYSWGFFIIPLLLICNRINECDRRDRIYAIMMSIPFVFLPFRISFYVSPGHILVYVMTAVLSVFTVLDTLHDSILFFRCNGTRSLFEKSSAKTS